MSGNSKGVRGGMEKMSLEQEKMQFRKQVEVDKEWEKRVVSGDTIVERFMNIDNGKNLDLKLKVLKALNEGKQPSEVDGYDKVVLVPKNEVWD